MPIKVQSNLPAIKILETENIFVMPNEVALRQDIRPLKILILNLMPTKIATETQLLRLLGNSPLQVDIELLQMASHTSKNTSPQHLTTFYKTFEEVRDDTFDGLIITGAPVEQIPFEEVDYWEELCEIMEWSKHNVYSTFHICWGAQAALYYHYGIDKAVLPAKLSGIYEHRIQAKGNELIRGFDDVFYAPHSRNTDTPEEEIRKHPELKILARGDDVGAMIVSREDNRQIFIQGHLEYDRYTLRAEYERDVKKGLDIHPPLNYFEGGDPAGEVRMKWRASANLFYYNWLNFVYQETPYDLADLEPVK
jgi:homoserine O-succinyltransferase